MAGKTIPLVAYIEDNPDHFEVVKRLLKRANPVLEIVWLRTVAEARRWLDEIETGRSPNLILLDIGLGGECGLEVLRIIKNTPSLRRLIAVVLSSSRHPADIQSAYDAHANAYLLKPGTLAEFADLIDAINLFWLEYNQPPVIENDFPPIIRN